MGKSEVTGFAHGNPSVSEWLSPLMRKVWKASGGGKTRCIHLSTLYRRAKPSMIVGTRPWASYFAGAASHSRKGLG